MHHINADINVTNMQLKRLKTENYITIYDTIDLCQDKTSQTSQVIRKDKKIRAEFIG